MASLVEAFASYVPALILRRFAADPTPLDAPEQDRFPAALLFADISGFTPLTERLAQRGPAGAEELSELLNTHFGQLIALIAVHGGDVVRFVGDALIALWTTTEGEDDLATATRRAVQCGLAVQTALNEHEAAEGLHLSLRVGVGAGEVLTMYVGGVNDRWELLLTGAPVDQMGAAEQQAHPGEVVLSPEAWQLVADACAGTPRGRGHVRVDEVRRPLPLRAALSPTLGPEAEAAVRGFVPGAVRSRLAAGQSDWLAELRRVTMLFVSLPDLDHVTPMSLPQTQRVIETLQRALYRYEGSLNPLMVDEKGVALVAAMGLPPLAHEDDAVRGVQAAQAMQAQLTEIGMRCAIGVATGRVFCGAIGSAERREYTMSGNVVVLAARLMQAANDEILCDAETFHAAQSRIDFDALPAFIVKGRADSFAVYGPRGQVPSFRRRRPMFGRAAERERLAGRLEALQTGEGSLVLIEGEAGIGKSRLVGELLDRARGVTALDGAGDAIEKSTPYHAWRPVFDALLSVEGLTDPEARRRRVLNRLHAESEWHRLAPLLNGVLLLDLPESEFTAQMTGQVRADNTHDLLLHLLQTAASEAPTVLVLEDAHWLDSASWALTHLVAQEVHPLLLVIVTRPMAESLPAEYRQLLQNPDIERLPLEALPQEDALALVCQRLAVARLPEPVAALICEKAQGNPFFTEELAYALRDAGLIQIKGECRLAPGVDLATVSFPDSVQGVITGRIDRLPPSQQLALKAASVIGRSFAFRILRDIYPIASDRGRLPDHLNTLARLDFTPLESAEPDLAYLFKHVITQEVAYNLMLFAQRRQLHRAVAEWYESHQAEALSPFYPLLAHHWSRAEEEAKTLDYLEKAGEQALRSGAYQEAVEFLSEALALDVRAQEGGGPGIGRLGRARRERELGEAHVGLGHLEESRVHTERALSLLGLPVPSTRSRLVTSIVGQIIVQVLHRLWPDRLVASSPEHRDIYWQAAKAYERIGHLAYYAQDLLVVVNAALRNLNLAERVGSAPELARSLAVGIAVSLVPLHRVAEFYCRRAEKIVEGIDDLSARAWVFELTGLYHFSVGRWSEGRARLQQAVEIAHRVGDWRRWEESSTQLSVLEYYQGHFAHAAKQFEEVWTAARRRGNDQGQAWGLCGQAVSVLRLGRTDEAAALLEEATALREERIGRTEAIWVYGSLAVARWRHCEQALALQAAADAMRLIIHSQPLANYALEGYAGAAEVYLAQWKASSDAPAAIRVAHAKLARQACKSLHRYARVLPIGQPRAWLLQGTADWLEGKLPRASKAWQKSLAAAERLAMPYEEGLAHYELGRHLGTEDPARAVHLARACEIFAQLAAAYDLERARAASEASVTRGGASNLTNNRCA
jgi:class 3 adenylate cyclase/tetratricopeptide (TPR) repeat protein